MKRLLGTIAALALALTALVGVQPAAAATSCEFAKQRAVSSALSLGDISLASKASRMCDAPCDSIYAYYLLPNLSSYVESLVLDAYKTCVAANSGGGGNGGGGGSGGGEPQPCTPKAFSKVGKPTLKGTAKTGHLLEVKNGGSWSPKPSKLTYKFYRDGKEISSFGILTTDDIGKKFSTKVTASLACYKTTSSWSDSSRVTKGNLPKFPSSQIKLVFWQNSESPNTFEFKAKNLQLWFTKGPVWTWVGHKPSEWANQYANDLWPNLPEKTYIDENGEELYMCQNGRSYKIGVTMTVGVANKYEPTKITLAPKSYTCVSNSDYY